MACTGHLFHWSHFGKIYLCRKASLFAWSLHMVRQNYMSYRVQWSNEIAQQECLTRVSQKRVKHKRRTNLSYKSVAKQCQLQECPIRDSTTTRVSHKSVAQGARVSNKSVLQEGTVSCNSAPPECPASVSYKIVRQECPVRVSQKSLKQKRRPCALQENPRRVSPQNVSQECL